MCKHPDREIPIEKTEILFQQKVTASQTINTNSYNYLEW